MRVTGTCLAAFGAAVFLSCPPVNAQVNTQRGATVGGLAGAAIGTAIGDHNGEAGAGAAIGGLLGAVAGGMLGNAADKQAAIDQQRRYYHQQQQQIAHVQSAVSLADVISMTRSGLSEAVIINQIQTRGVARRISVPDIIHLHEQGVTENVITTLQTASHNPQSVARAPVVVEQPIVHERVITPAPVIIHQHRVLPHYGPPRYYRHPRSSYGSSFHIRF